MAHYQALFVYCTSGHRRLRCGLDAQLDSTGPQLAVLLIGSPCFKPNSCGIIKSNHFFSVAAIGTNKSPLIGARVTIVSE